MLFAGPTDDDHALALVATPPSPDRGARVLVFDAQGAPRGEIALPGTVAHVLALPTGEVALGTIDGLVLAIDPTAPELPPRELARFARAVTHLRVEGQALLATGDERQPTPLADGEPAPPGSLVVEGELGRYAYPRNPVLRTLELPLGER